jgi:kelch-like protein 10
MNGDLMGLHLLLCSNNPLQFQIEDVDVSWKHGQSAAAIGFDIYVIGGRENIRAFNSCRCFNAVTKTWRDIAPMNQGR